MNIESFIKTIRESFHGSVRVYTSGSCYQFYLILKQVYPNAVAYYENDHVVTKIDNKYYDITGEVEGDFIQFSLMALFVKTDIKNNRFGITGYIECPHCEEQFSCV